MVHTMHSSFWKLQREYLIYQQGVSFAAADLLVWQALLDNIVVSTLLKNPSLFHKTQVLSSPSSYVICTGWLLNLSSSSPLDQQLISFWSLALFTSTFELHLIHFSSNQNEAWM